MHLLLYTRENVFFLRLSIRSNEYCYLQIIANSTINGKVKSTLLQNQILDRTDDCIQLSQMKLYTKKAQK